LSLQVVDVAAAWNVTTTVEYSCWKITNCSVVKVSNPDNLFEKIDKLCFLQRYFDTNLLSSNADSLYC